MSTEWLKSLYRRKDRLLALLYEFNLYPTRYIHPDWVEEFFPGEGKGFFERLAARPGSERRLSEMILDSLDVERDTFHTFEDPCLRFALLDSSSLKKLLRFTGIACGARWISHQLTRAAVGRLNKELGEGGYLFALKKAPFLVGEGPFPSCAVEDMDDLLPRLERESVRCLQACMVGAPESLVRRMLLKFPRELARHWEGPGDFGEASRHSVFPVMKKILFQEVGAGWAPYFS